MKYKRRGRAYNTWRTWKYFKTSKHPLKLSVSCLKINEDMEYGVQGRTYNIWRTWS